MTNEPPPRSRLAGYVFSAAVVLTVLSATVIFPRLSPAAGKAYPDILALEVAGWTAPAAPDSALAIVKRWRADDRLPLAQADVSFDFAFIVCYTVVFYYGVRLAADVFGHPAVGRWLSRGQIAAGLCDCAENVFLLGMLAEGAADDAVVAGGRWMTAFVWAKFVLLGAGAIHMLAAVCAAHRRRVERLGIDAITPSGG